MWIVDNQLNQYSSIARSTLNSSPSTLEDPLRADL